MRKVNVRESMAPVVGNPPSIEWQPVTAFEIDPSYQRSIETGDSRDAITRIALAWDWRLCGLLMVARRDGRLFIIDGQHRLEAARARGDISHLPCVIAQFETEAQEAECFVAINSARRPLTPVALFNAAVAAGDADACAINASLIAAGLTLTPSADYRSWAIDQIAIIGTIRKAAKRLGMPVVDRALAVYGEAFRGTLRRHTGQLFTATVKLIHEHDADDDLLIGVLAGEHGDGWAAAIREESLRTGAHIMAAAVSVVCAAYDEANAE